MFNQQIEKTIEDGTKLIFHVAVVDYGGRGFEITDLSVLPKRRRKPDYPLKSLRDDYSYRRLQMADRRKRELQEVVAISGIDLVNEVLREAWEHSKPPVVTLDSIQIDAQ